MSVLVYMVSSETKVMLNRESTESESSLRLYCYQDRKDDVWSGWESEDLIKFSF
jgi:hypothetical protein